MKSLIKKLAIASMIAMVISGGMINANEAKSETKKHPREYLTLKIDSNPKTGGFFGGELGLGLHTVYHNVGGMQTISNPPSFNINLIGGYQWYFYNHPNFSLGVRAKGYLGYGYKKFSIKNSNNDYYYGSSNEFNIGSELQILWDFLNIDKHSLGIHFSPIGFDVNVAIDNERFEINSSATNPGKNTKVTTTPNYTVSTGIHYYYNANHQLFLDYKYFVNNTYNDNYDFNTRLKHQFILGYSYKF